MLRPLFASLVAAILSFPGCPKSPPQHGLNSPRLATLVSIGSPVPDIVGVDLDGAPLKLSDERGKVVALSCWANWCHHCRNLFPHENALVEKRRGQPFVLIGINADEDRVLARSVQEKHQLAWRSFHVGDPEGPVPIQWGVRSWPTTFVIDARGILRYRFEGAQPDNVDRAVEELLREMDRKN